MYSKTAYTQGHNNTSLSNGARAGGASSLGAPLEGFVDYVPDLLRRRTHPQEPARRRPRARAVLDPATRMRTALACSRCRKMKIRCQVDPVISSTCLSCHKAGIHSCEYYRVGSGDAPKVLQRMRPAQSTAHTSMNGSASSEYHHARALRCPIAASASSHLSGPSGDAFSHPGVAHLPSADVSWAAAEFPVDETAARRWNQPHTGPPSRSEHCHCHRHFAQRGRVYHGSKKVQSSADTSQCRSPTWHPFRPVNILTTKEPETSTSAIGVRISFHGDTPEVLLSMGVYLSAEAQRRLYARLFGVQARTQNTEIDFIDDVGDNVGERADYQGAAKFVG
ncbi:hypothetical protein BU26DRAFT_500054 [Trematosphaeria pertusa]|uniref:Zn(2)-C6 fungal-type domain-containing protein n=1 Tax=Trematosphaeria pertusa TaxID=390896 RepID=A0A6A6IWG2_9PLEO|nr:uncharacterized protein BU26DRAFT_500054 [Trematosphaeria pertusa]KAF2254272.1 hypothetical protein BU26DRAFT_500054 [Trematosphaeria pertusa]